MNMFLAVPLVAHVLMSLLMMSIPLLTRREMLFGVIVPPDFRDRLEGKRAIRAFRLAVAIPAVIGFVCIIAFISRFALIVIIASGTTMFMGFMAFVVQNRRLKSFGIRPQPVREIALSVEPERLPWFVWFGLVPFVLLAVTALYLRAHWDSIPDLRPVHWSIDGQPDRWASRSFKGVYGPLILAAEMTVWLLGFALAAWYGARRSEPLRRPALLVFVTLSWVLGLMMCGISIQPLIGIPPVALTLVSVVVILSSVAYLIVQNRRSRGPLDPTPDECWKGGMLYYNPQDPVLFVGRRDGAGFTLNMGNRWSWAVIASPLILVVSGFLLAG